jgi:hypothetical protein
VSERLKLKFDSLLSFLLSFFAFSFNLRRYHLEARFGEDAAGWPPFAIVDDKQVVPAAGTHTRPLLSSMYDVSFCGISSSIQLRLIISMGHKSSLSGHKTAH